MRIYKMSRFELRLFFWIFLPFAIVLIPVLMILDGLGLI